MATNLAFSYREKNKFKIAVYKPYEKVSYINDTTNHRF